MKDAHQFVLVINLAGQYDQLVARHVRDLNVYCEVRPHTVTLEEIKELNPIGILLTGGHHSVNSPDAPSLPSALYSLGIPVLGIGYAAELLAHQLGGTVTALPEREYGKVDANITHEAALFKSLDSPLTVWMDHKEEVTALPTGFVSTASTAATAFAAFENTADNLYGVIFHPETNYTPKGQEILRHFLYDICGATGDWTMEEYAQTAIQSVRNTVGDGKVLLALSGGVDSSVLAVLLSEAIGNQLTCIFVDHGLMRKNEGDEVEAVFKNRNLNFVRVNAGDRFLGKLKDVVDPEEKRKIIGEEFIRIFEEEAAKIGTVDFLAQGTIYPDIVESGAGDAALIKSHHNVGGLPEHVDFKEIIEPLSILFKDEVRALGTVLGLEDTLVWRQPFPGPGLGVRIIGAITPDRVKILQEADWIYREEIASAGLSREISQYFAVLTDMRSVGVTDEARTYDYTVALRAVSTSDFMNAEWVRIPFDVLEAASTRITAEVAHVNRVVYDISSKPPATIEWE